MAGRPRTPRPSVTSKEPTPAGHLVLSQEPLGWFFCPRIPSNNLLDPCWKISESYWIVSNCIPSAIPFFRLLNRLQMDSRGFAMPATGPDHFTVGVQYARVIDLTGNPQVLGEIEGTDQDSVNPFGGYQFRSPLDGFFRFNLDHVEIVLVGPMQIFRGRAAAKAGGDRRNTGPLVHPWDNTWSL